MRSEACSAAVTMRADGLVDGMLGQIEASATNMLSVPYILVFVSTTEVPSSKRPSSIPILQVPIQVGCTAGADVGICQWNLETSN